MVSRPLLGAALLGLAAAVAAQPSFTRVIPEAASPGDLVVITGTALHEVVSVRFTASVGGFVGTWNASVAPTSATPTRLTVTVPTMAGFAPPGAVPPGNPQGSLTLQSSAGGGSAPFFFLQGTFIETKAFSFEAPQTSTLGTGTTQSTGEKAVATFDVRRGPPASGNANFVLELENAKPLAGAVVLLGLPGTPPFPMIGDGTLVLSPVLIALPGFTTSATGDASLPAAIPTVPFLGVTLAWQWAVVDTALPGLPIAVSNGLQFRL